MGIFLGMSLISVIDFIDVLFYISRKKIGKQNQNKEIKQNFRVSNNNLTDWCANSNIHGVSKLVQSRHLVLKVVWCIGLVTCIIYCVYTLIKNMEIYFKYEVYSNYEQIRMIRTPFPAITICTEENLEDDSIFLEKFCRNIEQHINLTVQDALIYPFGIGKYCYTFNSRFHKNFSQIRQANAVFNGNSASCFFLFSLNFTSNLHLYIHNETTLPPSGSYFLLTTGEEAVFGIRRIYRKIFDSPYGKCVNEWKSIDKRIYDFYTKYPYHQRYVFDYEQQMCLYYCVQ